MSSKCSRCRGVGHIITSYEYNLEGICPECRPKEFRANRERNKKLMFATQYGMSPVHFAAQEQISEIQAREMLKSTKGRFGQFKIKLDASLPEYAFKLEYDTEEEKEELLQLFRPGAPWL